MGSPMSPQAPSRPGDLDEDLVARLFQRANAVKWGLSRDGFSKALQRSLASHFRTAAPSAAERRQYLESLQLEELALAAACAEGQVAAWAYFIECFRPALRRAACAIAGDQAGGELADGLYAELYGLEERDGQRRSLFLYFHGRSRLSTWLRAVLAQTHVDCARAGRRLRPLEEAPEPVASVDAVDPQTAAENARLAAITQHALLAALSAIDAPDRLRLSYYYLQRMTLAQIGRVLGEHEATVSRKLDRTRRDLRARVERMLREQHHLGDDQVAACFAAAVADTGIDVMQGLDPPPRAPTQEPGSGSF